MSETSMRQTMRKRALEYDPTIQWQRIEDSCSVGIPDIYFCWHGHSIWIEAKQMDEEKLPKRANTPVRVGLKTEQALWLESHQLAKGTCFVVAKIGREWFVFSRGFRQLVDGMPLCQLRELATFDWCGEFRVENILPPV